MGFRFSQKSLDKMQGVHPDLVAVMQLAILRTPVDFTVIEGLRTEERQRQLVATGASRTMNSRHLTGHAVDVAPIVGGKVSWDWPLYHRLAPVIKAAAKELGVPIEWGGDWASFKDGPHWQLPFSAYGKTDMKPKAVKPFVRPDVEPIEPKQGFMAWLIETLMGLFNKAGGR